MAITTKAQLIAAQAGGQPLVYLKTSTVATVAGAWAGMFAVVGNPGPGTLAGTSTTAGVVPDDTVAGFPGINAFGAGNTGYLASVVAAFTNPNAINQWVGGRLRLSDMLWKAGAYSFNSNVTLSAQPSYSSRIPNADYKGTEIWFEGVTTFTGNPTITVTYTNQDGTTGRSTSIAVASAPLANRLIQIPLAAGDTGVQKIESVVASVATAGTFNLLVLRPLWSAHIQSGGETAEVLHNPDKTALPILFASSALVIHGNTDNAGTLPSFEALLTIING